MREALIVATEAAIRRIDAARFFQTERGFQGRFYCALQTELDRVGLISGGAILEMEYQKSARHGLMQRPDIIFHVPAEYSDEGVEENNYAVWALKRHATVAGALEDFKKLDQMFGTLHYPLGFFLNINSSDTMYQHYTGPYQSRIVAIAVRGGDVQIKSILGSIEPRPNP